jgi:hypothetical protein
VKLSRVAAVAAMVFALLITALPALAGGKSGSGSGPVAEQTICGGARRVIQNASGGIKVISRPNPFGTTQHLCIKLSGSRPGFKITTNMPYSTLVQAYPFTGVGCAYYVCSDGTELPRRVRSLSLRMNSSWDWSGTTHGMWNAAYDVWFDTRDQITTQDNGAELMIWLRTMPGYGAGPLVNIGGQRYRFMNWRTCHDGVCWNYIQFRFPRTVHGVYRLKLMPFIRYAERRGLIRPSWWLTSVHAGYELWSGGRGLATTWFNVHM